MELDGVPHDDPARVDYDAERTAFLGEQDIRIIRFENKEVFDNPDVVLQAISSCFEST